MLRIMWTGGYKLNTGITPTYLPMQQQLQCHAEEFIMNLIICICVVKSKTKNLEIILSPFTFGYSAVA